VQPVGLRESVKWPTSMPATSVIDAVRGIVSLSMHEFAGAVLQCLHPFGRQFANAELSTVNASREDTTMNTETMDTTNTLGVTGQGTSGLNGTNGANPQAQVQRVADKAHAAVDTVAQSISSGTERMMSWQQEYGELARDQIRENPLMVVAGAFALGYVLAKITR
jgi:ElaB/YqjD/DUF883 family membrane-anchored ribosome-binding protein